MNDGELTRIVGKTVASAEYDDQYAPETELVITFEDGAILRVAGSWLQGGQADIDVTVENA